MNPLDKVISEINKQYKTELVQKGTKMVYVEKIPFSSPRANYMTYGGIPIGKATEFFGPEGGGKTTSAIDIAAQAQKKAENDWSEAINQLRTEINELEEKGNKTDKKKIANLKAELEELQSNGPRQVVYVDAENTLDVEWAQLNGLNTDELILIRPQDHTAEQVLQMMLDLIDSGMVECMVLDSLPMLVSQNLYDENLEKKSYAGIAGPVTEFTRKVSPRLSKHRTALIIINQVRDNLDNPFDMFHTPGGRALRHLYALRLYFRKGSLLDEDNKEQPQRYAEPAGNIVDITVVKTKICKPDRRLGQYTLNYTTGIDVMNDTIDMAIKYNFIVQAGSWFQLINPDTGEILQDIAGEDLKFQGRAKLLEYLKDDEEMFEELYEAVTNKLEDAG